MPIIINDAKEAAESYQPLHLFDFEWADGSTLSVCTHAVTFQGTVYAARVLSQRIDPLQALSATGIDIPPSIKLTLADADKDLYQIEKTKKFRGARVVVTFAFYDFATQTFSEAIIPFVGRCDRPEVADDSLSVTASYILNTEAKHLPDFPIQPRCPKLIPATAAQKALANIAGSPYYDCGVTDPAKTTCTYDKAGCAANNNSMRFGGCPSSIPPASSSREYTSGNWLKDLQTSPSDAAYGDYAPLGWGTAWVDCKCLGSWPDGNSTRGEAIVCAGRPEAILKITVNDEVLPAASDLDGNPFAVSDPLFRYNVISSGDRTGALNQDHPWNGAGDPHGSLCVIEWVVYHTLTASVPRVRALVRFPKVRAYARIDHVAAGVVTLANNVPNRKIAGNPPFTITIFGNANAALNGTHTLSDWAYGPPGTVTLGDSTASGAGGYIEYQTSSDDYAWAILNVLQRVGLQDQDVDPDAFVDASEKFAKLVSYTPYVSTSYASGVEYALGDLVLYAGQTYQSLQGENIGHEPDQPASSDWWVHLTNGTVPAGQPQPAGTAAHPKYTCSLVVEQRRTAADLLAGMLRGCNAHLGRNLSTGQIALFARGTLAEQQPALPDGSNYAAVVDGGHAAYHFSESSMVRQDKKSTFYQVARGAAAIPNVVTVAFANEENDYSGDSVKVPDSDDISLMGQEIQGNITVDGCNALDRANRIGSIFIAEQLGGEVWQFVSTAKFIKGLVGQIVLISNIKHGFDHQPFRVQQIAPDENWKRCTIQASVHDDAWYADDLSSTQSTGSPASRSNLTRPPRPWCPNLVSAAAGDPLCSASEYSFGLDLTYEYLGDGTPQAQAAIAGVKPVNRPANLQPPVLKTQGSTANVGGTIPGGGQVYFMAAASKDANGNPGPVSEPCQIAVAQAGNLNTITAPVSYWDPNGHGYILYAGKSPARLTRQADGADAPAFLTLTALLECGEGQPDTRYDSIDIRPSWVAHVGPFAQQINAVGSGTLTLTGAGWTANDWVGYDCTILYKYDGSAVPVRNFRVTGNTADTLTVTPDPAALGVAPGDLLGMLSKPTVTGLTLADPRWRNTLSNSGLGLTPHAEKGKQLRFIAGKGRGYRYPIGDNDATSVTSDAPWVIEPDSTTRYIIEDTMPLPGLNSGSQVNSDPAAQMTLVVPVANYAGEVLLFEAVTRSADGLESATQNNPVRMVWVAGKPSSAAGSVEPGPGLKIDPVTGKLAIKLAAAGDNWTANPNLGFESGLTGWTVTNGGLYSGGGHSGTKRCDLWAGMATPGKVTEAVGHSCNPGDSFTATAWMGSNNYSGATGMAVMQLDWYDAAGTYLSNSPLATWAPTLWNWVQHGGSAVAPDGAASVKLTFRLAGELNETWFLDDITFDRTAAAVASGMTFDANGNLVLNAGQGVAVNGNNQIVSKAGPGLTYDANGRMIPNQGATVGVDANGQLVVPASSLGLTQFGGTLQPYGYYYGLPSAYDSAIPKLIINTVDWKIYRNIGGSWSKQTDPSDIIAGTISALVSLISPAISGGTITGATLSITNGSMTIVINNSGITIQNTSAHSKVVMDGNSGTVKVQSTDYPNFWALMSPANVMVYDGTHTGQLTPTGTTFT